MLAGLKYHTCLIYNMNINEAQWCWEQIFEQIKSLVVNQHYIRLKVVTLKLASSYVSCMKSLILYHAIIKH